MDRLGSRVYYGDALWDLTPAERRWGDALKKVYNVGESYYFTAKPEQRRKIEKNIGEWAKKDDRRGRKAAEVVAFVVAATIDESNRPKFEINRIESKTGRMAAAYGMGTQNIARQLQAYSMITGLSADVLIADELVSPAKSGVEATTRLHEILAKQRGRDGGK